MPSQAQGLSERLRQLREQSGKSQRDFAADINASFRAYQDYEAGRIMPGAKVLANLAAFGIDLNWLLRGSISLVRPVPHVDAATGTAGPAVVGLAPERHNPGLLSMEIKGDSMEPELGPGDIVLFDETRRDMEAALFVLVAGGQMMVRRLQPLIDGRVEIRPVNPIYRVETMTADSARALVAGRIVAVMKRV